MVGLARYAAGEEEEEVEDGEGVENPEANATADTPETVSETTADEPGEGEE